MKNYYKTINFAESLGLSWNTLRLFENVVKYFPGNFDIFQTGKKYGSYYLEKTDKKVGEEYLLDFNFYDLEFNKKNPTPSLDIEVKPPSNMNRE